MHRFMQNNLLYFYIFQVTIINNLGYGKICDCGLHSTHECIVSCKTMVKIATRARLRCIRSTLKTKHTRIMWWKQLIVMYFRCEGWTMASHWWIVTTSSVWRVKCDEIVCVRGELWRRVTTSSVCLIYFWSIGIVTTSSCWGVNCDDVVCFKGALWRRRVCVFIPGNSRSSNRLENWPNFVHSRAFLRNGFIFLIPGNSRSSNASINCNGWRFIYRRTRWGIM